MRPRLTTDVWIGALRRRVESAGGFCAVLRRGNSEAGSVLLVLRESKDEITVVSKVNTTAGSITWQRIIEKTAESGEILANTLDKQQRYDPDVWIVELDVANPARFIDGEII